MWTIDDHTDRNIRGYLRVNLSGQRVFDAFPYAQGTNADWVRQQTQRVVDAMNAQDKIDAAD